jgi:hypothetical protein
MGKMDVIDWIRQDTQSHTWLYIALSDKKRKSDVVPVLTMIQLDILGRVQAIDPDSTVGVGAIGIANLPLHLHQ